MGLEKSDGRQRMPGKPELSPLDLTEDTASYRRALAGDQSERSGSGKRKA